MKLYNLYNTIILEGINRALLKEGVNGNSINDCINNQYNVRVMYKDEGETTASRRFLQVYTYGRLKGGDKKDAIRAYQLGGVSVKGGKVGKWKTFLVERIESWETTKSYWKKPVSTKDSSIIPYKEIGDDLFEDIYNQVNSIPNDKPKISTNNSKNQVKQPQDKEEEPTGYDKVSQDIESEKIKQQQQDKEEPQEPKQSQEYDEEEYDENELDDENEI